MMWRRAVAPVVARVVVLEAMAAPAMGAAPVVVAPAVG